MQPTRSTDAPVPPWRRRLLGAAVILAAAAAAPGALGQTAPRGAVEVVGAGLDVTPHRLILKPGDSAEVVVRNLAGPPTTFAIAVIDRVMQPDGRLLTARELVTPAEKARGVAMPSAAAHLQVDASEVTLAGGESRTIHVAASRDAPAGVELHSHLSFRAVAPEARQATALNISIAVFIRSGPVEAAARLENPQVRFMAVDQGAAPAKVAPVLGIDLVRLGRSSLFGALEVRSVNRGRAPIGQLTSLAVYPEIARRRVEIPLARAPDPGERLEVRFVDADATPGAVLASTDLRVGPSEAPRPVRAGRRAALVSASPPRRRAIDLAEPASSIRAEAALSHRLRMETMDHAQFAAIGPRSAR